MEEEITMGQKGLLTRAKMGISDPGLGRVKNPYYVRGFLTLAREAPASELGQKLR